MQKSLVKKGLVLVIIVLFVGVSILPNISGYTQKNRNHKNIEITSSPTRIEISDQSSGSDWWPMFQHDAHHSGYTTSEGPLTNEVLWKHSLSTNPYINSPVVYKDRVYMGARFSEWMNCFDAENGDRLWHYDAGSEVGSTPAVQDDKLFYGTLNGVIHCLNATSGDKIWDNTTVGAIVSSPSIYDEKLYIGSTSGIYCLDINTGTYVWNITLDDDVRASPAVFDGKVYFGCYDTKFYCLDAYTGHLEWDYNTNNPIYYSAAVVDEKVYFCSSEEFNPPMLYCLDAYTGNKNWELEGDWGGTPAVANGKLYLGSCDYNIYCLNADTGSEIWKFETGDIVYSSPAISDGRLYIGSVDSNVYCLNADTGIKIWNYKTGGGIVSSPAIFQTRLYIASGDDYLYAFGHKDIPPEIPEINGPHLASPGSEVDFTIVSSDPEHDKVSYYIEWGDGDNSGWLGPFNSGETIDISHKWISEGSNSITVIAKDSHGKESESSYHSLFITPITEGIILFGIISDLEEYDGYLMFRTNNLFWFSHDPLEIKLFSMFLLNRERLVIPEEYLGFILKLPIFDRYLIVGWFDAAGIVTY